MTRLTQELEQFQIRVQRALYDAQSETYHDHERSTCDPDLKRRISNATRQMVSRTLHQIFGAEWAAQQNVQILPWRVTLADIQQVQVTIARARETP